MKPGAAPGEIRPLDVVADAARLRTDLSPGQAHALLRYRDLLAQRAVPMGLVAEGDAGRIYRRHILDCLAAAPAFRPSDAVAYDLGSGAGLPGIVLAVALPDTRFVLVESRSRRAGFLELAAEVLGLANVDVAASRAEELDDGGDVATARAFAPLERSWEAARGLLRRGGRLVYFAGRGVQDPERQAAGLPGVREVSVLPVLDSSAALVIMSRT